MQEIENISRALFDKIRTRFDDVHLGDKKAMSTADPEKARYFNFNYESQDGTKFGNVTVSLIDEAGLKIYYNKSVTDQLEDQHKDEWFKFLRSMREFAKRNLLSFDVRDISKSNLELKDIKQSSKSDSVYTTDDFRVTESRLYGHSPRRSFEDRGTCRIRVDHSENIDLEKRGARGRKIESVFLETADGERFRMEFNNMHYARAMAEHLHQGGRPYDEIAEAITEMAREMSAMGHFVRGVRRRQFDDPETQNMVDSACRRHSELREKMRGISDRGHYQEFVETYAPAGDITDSVDVDSLRERFVKKIYNDRFDEALPYVYRAYQQQQSQMENAMSQEFSQWADDVTEGTWSTPDSDREIAELDELMQKPIAAGIDGDNANGVLYDLIGDDELFDQFTEVARNQGPDTDIRNLVVSWLDANGYAELAAKYRVNYEQPDTPEQPERPKTVQGATTMDEPVVTENTDELSFIRTLAGLR